MVVDRENQSSGNQIIIGLHPEKRCPHRLVVTLVFRYRLPFGKEIKRERWVDQEVNPPMSPLGA